MRRIISLCLLLLVPGLSVAEPTAFEEEEVLPGAALIESAMFKKGHEMGRIASTAEVCGLPSEEVASRMRWLKNWRSHLSAEDRESYGLGMQQGVLDVAMGGFSMPCDTSVSQFRQRTKLLDY